MVALVPRLLAGALRAAAKQFPVVTVTGPRQSGKTTLCRAVFPRKPYASLEDPDVRAFATEDPRGFLARFPRGAILDEIQRAPDLASYIQGLVDRDRRAGRFVLTGSQNLGVMSRVSQSLAGRTALLTLLPLSSAELQGGGRRLGSLESALLRGGYPPVAVGGAAPAAWHAAYVSTYAERDVRQLLNVANLSPFQSFLRLVAGRSGQVLNLSALGSDCGVTHDTARAWLSVLEASWLVFRLPPFQRNLRKRLVKAPKIYLCDTGLLCTLLGIRDEEVLVNHPLRGAIFETWVASEIMKAGFGTGLQPKVCFFRDHRGLEVDFVVEAERALVAVEAKAGKTPSGDALDAIASFAGLLPTAEMAALRRVAVYGGEARQDRDKGTLLPWRQVTDVDWVTGALSRPRR